MRARVIAQARQIGSKLEPMVSHATAPPMDDAATLTDTTGRVEAAVRRRLL
jgi:hypothetical protein